MWFSILTATLLTPVYALAEFTIGGSSNGGIWAVFSSDRGGSFSCGKTICGIADTILYLINGVAVPVLFAVAFITFLYGVAQRYIFHPDEVDSGHQFILWGVVGFVVMLSLWGLVFIVANTFGLDGYYAPPLPTSYTY